VCDRSGKFREQDYSSSSDLRPLYFLYLYYVLHVRDNKWMHSRSSKRKRIQSGDSSRSGCSWVSAAEVDTISAQFSLAIVFTRDTTTQGCWCVRVGGCTRLTQIYILPPCVKGEGDSVASPVGDLPDRCMYMYLLPYLPKQSLK